MARLYGCVERLTIKNGEFRPGQEDNCGPSEGVWVACAEADGTQLPCGPPKKVATGSACTRPPYEPRH